MKKENLIELLTRYEAGWTLEQPFYTSQDIFNIDMEVIWKKYWLYVGITAEIPKPGDYFTYKIGKDSIIIIRGDKGEVYAHHNSCRHRGSLICLEERGKAVKLMCPYHQWVYNKDGSLAASRLMPEDFDKSEFGLHPVHVRVIEGVIFISLADDPADFSQVENDYSKYLKPYKFDKAKIVHRERHELNANWKLITENFRECYHCGPTHPEYCRVVIGANLKESPQEVIEQKRPEWEAKGLATKTILPKGESYHLAIRYPLRPGVESYSLDGKRVSSLMGDHQDYESGVMGLCLFPNFWMDAVSDYAWSMRITPVSAVKCMVDVTWFVDEKAEEGKDYNLEKLTSFWQVTGGQDFEICKNNHQGVESSHYRPGPYSPAEIEVADFTNWYINTLRNAVGIEVTT